MSKVYVISDTHFGHKKIIQYCRTQFATVKEMNECIIDNWNSVVTNRDTVIHLGDVVMDAANNVNLLEELNGYKRLVMGNHDNYRFLEKFFDTFHGSYEHKGFILTHVPVHRTQVESRFTGNIHGHLHELSIGDPKYRCVSVEQTNFRPILLSKVIEEMLEKING